MTRKQNLVLWTGLVTVTFSVLFALMAYTAGQDANFDFYNYHFYNAFAFLNDRFWFDIQPAQRQTFFSPFLDVPFYWLTETFNVTIASQAYAVFQSWQAPAAFLLVCMFLETWKIGPRMATAVALLLTAVAILCPMNLQLVGTTAGDNTTATVMLWALTCLLLGQSSIIAPSTPRKKKVLVCLAGLLAGLAVGLKLTNGPFAVALALCVFLFKGDSRLRFQLFLLVSLSILTGFMVAYGYWGWFLYDQFQNPFFPLFNHVFHSEFMKPVELNDETFKATSWLGVALYPIIYNVYTGAINYQQFLDLRIPVVYVLMVLMIPALLISKRARQRLAEHPLYAMVLLFNAAAYLLWIQLFSISRYLLVLEVLTPLTLAVMASLFFSRKWLIAAGFVIALFPVVASSWDASRKAHAFGPRTDWADSVFEVDLPNFELENAMVLVSGGQAMAFIIPTAPPSARFVRIDSNLNYVNYTSIAQRYENRMGQRLREAIASHSGAFYIIYTKGEEVYVDSDLAYFEISRLAETCREIKSKGPFLYICRAERIADR